MQAPGSPFSSPAELETPHARHCGPEDLAAHLRRVRARLLALVDDLAPGQWQVPLDDGLNPFAWELAHVAWFAEWWTLRGPHRAGPDGSLLASQPARIAGPDRLLDSSLIPHAQRWVVELPGHAQVRRMLEAQLDASLAQLSNLPETDAALYFHRLALMHEAMHCEALAWMRSRLGYPAPRGLPAPEPCRFVSGTPDPVVLAGARATLGQTGDEQGFSFDNENDGFIVELEPFDIDPEPVSAGRYRAFVDAGGYDDPRWWPGDAGRWRARHPFAHPMRWRNRAGNWEVRSFDQWTPLDPSAPVMHVSAWEAEAWCRWAGRRLPSAAQWQTAAQANLIRWGKSVWEWTSDSFQPYPGFRPGPYREYSAHWFGTHRELRGGAFATDPVIRHQAYRNFFLPGRTDLFAGFRSASLDRCDRL